MDRSVGWRPVVAAFAFVFITHVALYFWWVGADMLLSDDYSFFDPTEDFAEMVELFFRPLYRMIAIELRDLALRTPDAIFTLKAVHLLLTGIFVGCLAAFFARTSRSAIIGIAAGILAATGFGQQINSVWLNIAPQMPTYILAVLGVWCIAAAAKRSLAGGIAATAAVTAAMVASMFLYQMAPFYMVGLVGAYIVLTKDDDATVVKSVILSAVCVVVAVGFYAVALNHAVAIGVTAGRAASATSLSAMAERIAATRPDLGFSWGGLLIRPGAAMELGIAVILLGAVLSLWNSPARRPLAMRWGAAIVATAGALFLPAVLNNFQGAARLYIPGAIGIAGLLVAAAAGIWTTFGAGWAAIPLKFAGAGTLLFTAVTASASTVLAVGLPQYAEIQYIRTLLAAHEPGDTKGVYIIIPPKGTPFWEQPRNAGREDLYALSMSTYHYWTFAGIVRYALRHADPRHAIPIMMASPDEPPPEGWTIVDMRPYDRAFSRVP